MVCVAYGFIQLKKQKQEELKNIELLKISVLIPARNEENSILRCLTSLANQNYNTENFEVIVIDDNSTDNTKNIVVEFISSNNLNCQLYFLEGHSSKKEALKYGIEKSSYDIIATTDSDSVLPRNWLNSIAKEFSKDAEMLLGPIMFKNTVGFLANFQILDMLALQGVEFGTLYYKKPILNNAANLSYLKKSYNNVNGIDIFNTPSGDDIFLLQKFKKQNHIVQGLLNESFIVETQVQDSFSELLSQRVRWASKSKFYTDGLLVFFSLIVLIQNIFMIFIYLGISLVEKYTLMLIILLFCKWLIDFILLFLVASFFKRMKALFYFIPVQIVYPIYIIIVWLVSIMGGFEWKGRKYG